MKVTKKHIRLASYAGISAALYAVVMFILAYIFGVQRYGVSVDPRIIPALSAQLIAQVQTLPCGLRVSPDASAQKIQEQFPWVSGISFQRIPTNAMEVKVAAEEPEVKVNTSIITEHLRILPAATFVPASLAEVPALQVTFSNAKGDIIPRDFIRHAKTFTAERFSPYIITWVDEYHARLTDKEQSRFSILFNAHSIPDASMFAHCVSIKKQLEERGSFMGRYKDTRWVADVRFERQIIVFSEKGGAAHG